MSLQTPDDIERLGEQAAADAQLARDFGQGEAAINSAWCAVILFGAAEVIKRRRAGGPRSAWEPIAGD